MTISKHSLWVFALFALIGIFPAYADGSVPVDNSEENSKIIVIHAGHLMTDARKKISRDKSILIKEGRIFDIKDGYWGHESLPDAQIEIIDLRNYYVLPGLMDMHVHLSFEYGNPGQRSQNHADEYKVQADQREDALRLVDAILNAKKTLMAGYTTVRNVGASGWHIFTLRDAIKDGNLVGPRIFTAGHTIRVGADDGPGACYDVGSCRLAVRRQIDMGADLIKIYATCSGGKPCGQQDALPVFLQDEMEAVVQTAHSRQLTVAAHAHGTAGINLALSAGVNSIEHGSYNDSHGHALFKKTGAFLVPTASVVQINVKSDLRNAESPMREVMQNFVEQHPKRMLDAYRAGVKIAAGSDAGVTKHGENAKELQFYVEAGMPAKNALIAATIHGAELLGQEKNLGTLDKSKVADIIAVKSNPLDDIKILQRVDFVMKDGKVFKHQIKE